MKPSILLDDIEQKVIINPNGPLLFRWSISYNDPELNTAINNIRERRPGYILKQEE